ncbi:MAG: type IV pilus biogenesis/stability protein PilW [Gammaproteobacteria bacterium]|jgi:type IV pilus assembly protein PilF
MKRTVSAIFVGLLLLAQSACVTTETNPVEVSLEDAAKANLQLGANYLQRGELELAREKLEKAVDQDPKLPGARIYLAILYERIGEQKLADENYRAALKLAPKNPDVANSYGGYLCRTGEREKGLEYFRQAGENALYRTPEVAFTNAAVCALGIPDLKTAERFLRRALEANPTFREALLRLSVLSLDTDRPLQARAFLERFHSAGPATIDSLSLGVRIESALGDEVAAEAYRQRIRDEFPEEIERRRRQEEVS